MKRDLMDEPTMRIGEVARRTGLTPATIRAWQRRYGLLAPARSDGGQRLYSDEDVRVLDEVSGCVAEGWALSVAAEHVVRQRTGRVTGDGAGSGVTAREVDLRAPRSTRGGRPADPGPDGPGPQAHIAGVIVAQDEIAFLHSDDIAVAAVHRATRAMLRASSPTAVVLAVSDLVRELGGEVVSADHQTDDEMPVDLGLGVTDPMLPSAEAFSMTRLRLEAVLPGIVEDARHMVATLRRVGVGGSSTVDDEHLSARRRTR